MSRRLFQNLYQPSSKSIDTSRYNTGSSFSALRRNRAQPLPSNAQNLDEQISNWDDGFTGTFDDDESMRSVSTGDKDANALADRLFYDAMELDIPNDEIPASQPIDPEPLPQPNEIDQVPQEEFVDHADAESIAMPPPPIPFAGDSTEEVFHRQKPLDMDEWLFAMALFIESAGLSRKQYQQFRSAMLLLTDISRIQNLPRRLDTLKNSLRAQLPLLKMRQKDITLDVNKIPTRVSSSGTVFSIDPAHLFRTILLTPRIRAKMHFGMAILVENQTELWHSNSWASSIRTTSGDFAHFTTGEPVFPSDIVLYKCNDMHCGCLSRSHAARICAVMRDHTVDAIKSKEEGRIILYAQKLLSEAELPSDIYHTVEAESLQPPKTEIFIVEDQEIQLTESSLLSRGADVYIDYEFGTDRTSNSHKSRIVLRRILNMGSKSTRPINLSSPIRGELEIQHFGRSNLVEQFKPGCLSLPLICFIDDFGVYRNMYRSLTGIYLTLASMTERQRTRRLNTFALTLGPYASEFGDVINALGSLRAVDRGTTLQLENEAETRFCAPVLCYTGDMPQQLKNSGFMGPTATLSCRDCTIDSSERGNLDFDIKTFGRYHHRTLQLRNEANAIKNKRSREKFFREYGMAIEQSPLVNLTPALDIIKSRPSDAAHSEYQGIARHVLSLLFSTILTEPGQNAFVQELSSHPLPPGYTRFQNAKRHLASYKIHEYAKLSIVLPVLLRCWLVEKWIQPLFLASMKKLRTQEMADYGPTPADWIVQSYASIAASNAAILQIGIEREHKDDIQEKLIKSRRSYQWLLNCAVDAARPAKRRSSIQGQNAPAHSTHTRAPSPALSVVSAASSTILNPGTADPTHLEGDKGDIVALEMTKEPSKKAKGFEAMKSRPNVHLALHYSTVVSEYATPRNVMALMGEDKHRLWKNLVQRLNGIKIERSLLTIENITQTLRFLVGGAYEQSDPELTAVARSVYFKCPELFKSILPVSESPDDIDDDEQFLLQDKMHQEPAAIARVKSSYAREVQKLPLRPDDLASDDPFRLQLQTAYAREYEIKNVWLRKTCAFQWCKRFSFTDPTRERRCTYSINDFIRLRDGSIGRIEYLFSHELSGIQRLFIACTLADTDGDTFGFDPILGLPFMELTDEQKIFGLPAVVAERIWMIPVESRPEGLRRGGDRLLLHCTWDVMLV
ncbi:MAG: hypothetical protein M1820_010214 [Bogoriella megaspora]|nr:MAG: hypothetical protein M1820_010214 [Bogoriella megaspora]